MKKIIIVGLVVCVAMVGICYIKNPFKKEVITVKIAYAQYASPFFVALDKGFFTKEGVTVEMVSMPAVNATTQALAKGDIDVASLPYAMLFPFEIATPGKFKVFSAVVETKDKPYSYFFVKENITMPEDLKGKKVVTRSGLNGKVQATLIFKAMGIDPSDIELVQVESPLTVATFAKDDMSGVIDVEPSAAAIQQKKLGKILVSAVRPKYLFDPYPTTALVFSTTFVERNKKTAEKIQKATDMAIDFIKTNDKESRLIMQKYLQLDDEIASSVSPSVYQKFSEIDKHAIEKEMVLEFENALIKQKIDLKNIYFQL